MVKNILKLLHWINNQYRKPVILSHDVHSVFVNSNGLPPPWSLLSWHACMDLRPLTVQTSSAVSVWTPATSIIISSRDNTLPFPSLQDCQVSPVAVGFGRRLAARLRQAGSCSIHHSSMTFTEISFLQMWDKVTWGHTCTHAGIQL